MSSNTRPRTTRDVDSMAVIATWMRRVGLPLAILAWTGVALLAYALAPAVNFLERVMPRFLAILIVYLIVLGAEVNAFVKGVRDTPNDLVTMVT